MTSKRGHYHPKATYCASFVSRPSLSWSFQGPSFAPTFSRAQPPGMSFSDLMRDSELLFSHLLHYTQTSEQFVPHLYTSPLGLLDSHVRSVHVRASELSQEPVDSTFTENDATTVDCQNLVSTNRLNPMKTQAREQLPIILQSLKRLFPADYKPAKIYKRSAWSMDDGCFSQDQKVNMVSNISSLRESCHQYLIERGIEPTPTTRTRVHGCSWPNHSPAQIHSKQGWMPDPDHCVWASAAGQSDSAQINALLRGLLRCGDNFCGTWARPTELQVENLGNHLLTWATFTETCSRDLVSLVGAADQTNDYTSLVDKAEIEGKMYQFKGLGADNISDEQFKSGANLAYWLEEFRQEGNKPGVSKGARDTHLRYIEHWSRLYKNQDPLSEPVE